MNRGYRRFHLSCELLKSNLFHTGFPPEIFFWREDRGNPGLAIEMGEKGGCICRVSLAVPSKSMRSPVQEFTFEV